MFARAVCMVAVVSAEVVMDDIAAYFSLAGGEAVDDMFAMVECTAPMETKVDPDLGTFDETPENDAESTEHWSGEGTASLFTGDDWFECDESVTAMVSGAEARTVCLWANVMEITDGGMFSFGNRRVECEQYGLRTVRPNAGECGSSGCLQLNLWGGDCDLPVAFDPAWQNTWKHYCATYDGTTASMFVDAEMVASEPRAIDTGAASGGETSFYIGYNDLKTANEDFTSFFVGAMSDVYIFTKALTTDEMEEVMMGTFETPPPAMVPTTNSTGNSTMAPTMNGTNFTNMSMYM
mmetsp:Transcript_7927/g.24342  ORF Transcript_7927/g.24342 Transcript_7927/m.24342 type:complete len:293 (-) Transcript_7927:709-1587(-)